MFKHRTMTLIFVWLLPVLLNACHTPPLISSFTATPASLPVGGGSLKLEWSVVGADTISIDQGVGTVSGTSTTVNVTTTKTFTLTALNSSGITTASAAVTVAAPPATSAPTISSFNATPPNLPVGGGQVTLAWSVKDATSLSISPDVGVVTGNSVPVTLTSSTMYTLTASNNQGSTSQNLSVTVALTPPTAIIPGTTKVADPSTKNALTGFDLKTGVMRFSQNTSLLQTLQPGDVLSGGRSSNAPNGFLRKVTSIKSTNGETVLETTQAMLTDAISKGKIDVSGTLTAANLHTAALRPGVALRSGRFRGGFNQEANVDVTYHPEAPGTGEVHITGLVDFNLGYHIGLDIDACFQIPPVCLNHFDASVGFEQLADLKVTGHLETPIKKDIEIASSDYWTTISILDIEIPVDFKVSLSIGLDGKTSVQFSYQGTQNVALNVGEEYNDGRGWSPIAEKSFTLLPGAPQVTGSVEVQATTDFEAQVLLIGFVGPGLKASAGLELNGEIPRNPIWTLSGLASLDVTFVVDVPVIGKIVDYSANILKWSSELARSQNTPPTISIQTNPSNLEFGRPFYFASGYPMYAASDLEDGTVNNLKLSSDKDGAIDTNHVFNTEGSRLITVTATDSQGASSSGSFTLNVINTPPKVSLTTSTNLPVYVGIPTELSGHAEEINPVTGQPNLPVPCNRMYWTSSNATDVVPSSCNGSVTFTSNGVRTLTLTAVGKNGALGIAEVLIAVTDPPKNLPPVIDEMHVKDNTGTEVTANQTVATGAALLLSVKAHDPENDPIHYQWSACLTSWTPLQCSLNGDLPTNADGAATFDFLNRFGYGTYNLFITADDGHQTFATIMSRTITITPKIN